MLKMADTVFPRTKFQEWDQSYALVNMVSVPTAIIHCNKPDDVF
jgi:hypothetical protein